MPQQEKYYEQTAGDRRVEVVKTYDQNYAREAFGNMDEAAQGYLRNALRINELYDESDIPVHPGSESEDFLWEELVESAREDGSLLSFFVVNETEGNRTQSLYVAPDWPSAEAFAKSRIEAA